MKILIISFYYSPALCAGSFRTTAFVKALQDNLTPQDSIDVITTLPNRYKSFRTDTKGFEVDGNISIKRIKVPSHSSGFYDQAGSFVSYFVNALREVRGREYDVVFATSSRLFSGFLGAVISRWKGAPLYLDMRDILTDSLESVLGNSGLRAAVPLLRLVEKFTMKSAGRINLVSKGFATYFQNKYRKDYSYFPNGIAYYRESDILFLQLNNYEAFKKVLPSKIFEYAAMYKPIIAGVDGYAKEFLEEHLPDSLVYKP